VRQHFNDCAGRFRHCPAFPDRGQEASDIPAALSRDDAKLSGVSPKRVDQLCALSDQQVSSAMHHEHRLLFFRLDRYEAHGWPANRLADRCRVGGIVLTALQVCLHISRRH